MQIYWIFMKLKRLTFINHKTGWHVKNVQFGSLTLLVGASGVGKTQILKSLSALSRIADGNSLNGREWFVEFEETGINYIWSGYSRRNEKCKMKNEKYNFCTARTNL